MSGLKASIEMLLWAKSIEMIRPGETASLALKVASTGITGDDINAWPAKIEGDQTIPFVYLRAEGKPFVMLVTAGDYGDTLVVPKYTKITERSIQATKKSAEVWAYCPFGGSNTASVVVTPSGPGWHFLSSPPAVAVPTMNEAYGWAGGDAVTVNPSEKQILEITDRSASRIVMNATCYPQTKYGANLKGYISVVEEKIDFVVE